MAQGAGEGSVALAGPQPVAENPPYMSGGLANAGAWLLARARAIAAEPWLAAALVAAALLGAAALVRMRRLRPALAMQREVKQVHVDPVVKQYLVAVAVASRSLPAVRLGISPRGTLAWMAAAQSFAYLQGRSYVIPDDVKEVAVPVLSHRIQMRITDSFADQ